MVPLETLWPPSVSGVLGAFKTDLPFDEINEKCRKDAKKGCNSDQIKKVAQPASQLAAVSKRIAKRHQPDQVESSETPFSAEATKYQSGARELHQSARFHFKRRKHMRFLCNCHPKLWRIKPSAPATEEVPVLCARATGSVEFDQHAVVRRISRFTHL